MILNLVLFCNTLIKPFFIALFKEMNTYSSSEIDSFWLSIVFPNIHSACVIKF